MSDLPVIPPEIHGQIAGVMVSKGDLCSYLRICKAVFGEVERHLYRSIHLSSYDSHAFDGFTQGLSNHPHRPLLVREFLLSLGSIPIGIVPQLASALAAMVNLIHLDLNVHGLEFSDFGYTNREDRHKPFAFNLQRFKYLFSGDGPRNGSLANFLISQPSITTLLLPVYTSSTPLPSTCLPNLRIMQAPARLGETLLPGRAIDRLHWTSSGSDGFPSDLPHLSLRVLKIYDRPRKFRLQRACPNIRYFEFPAPYNRAVSETVGSLRGLSFLHTVCLYGPGNPGKTYEDLAQECFREVDTLQVFRNNSAQMWRRGEPIGCAHEIKVFPDLWRYWTEDIMEDPGRWIRT